MRRENKSKLLRRLAKAYPQPKSELNFKSAYELLIAVVLSAQCTDKKVNQITPILFEQYPDFERLSQASIQAVEKIIRPINYYRTKARNLVGTAQLICEKLDGRIPTNRAELIQCPGIGQKSANVILGELGHEKTFPVDTHVFRVSRRLGLASGNNPQQVEEELMRAFHKKYWRSLHHWLILHGRRVCNAQRPKCAECSLADICPSRQTGPSRQKSRLGRIRPSPKK